MPAGRRRGNAVWPLLVLAVAGLVPVAAAADSTLTLPRGIIRVHLRPLYSFFTERWDQNGSAERVTNDLDGRDLNSEVFSDISTLERLYGTRARALSLGVSRVQSRIHIAALGVAGEYGITDRLTVGVVLPIIHARHTLTKLELEPVQTCDGDRCGMGLNPGDTNISVEDSKYLPLDHDKDPSTKTLAPLQREDVQGILVDDLGYERLDDWSSTGIGDLELGIKYRFLESRFVSSSAQLGLRLPTGRVPDPNNLLALPLGDGQTDLGLAWHTDVTPLRGLRLNLTLRYTVQLPDGEVKRIPTSADVPLTRKEDVEEVWRDLGDYFELELGAAYAVREWLIPYVTYNFVSKEADDIRGNLGLTYRALMDETALRNHSLEVGLSFSTLPWVVRRRTSIPLALTLSYARSLAGRNNAPISNVLSLDISGFFKVL